MKKKLCVLLSILLTLSLLPVQAAGVSFTPHPQTPYAQTFVAQCEGQQWFIDEVERLLNAEQKTIDTVTDSSDFDGIVSLGLRDHGISGKIPAAVGELKELRYLFLSGNELSGAIPASLYALPKLENVDLAGNAYSGAIPTGFGAMPALKELNLKDNAFTGSIPADILADTGLTFLDVSGNRLSGAIPTELNQMTGLEYLAIANNPWSAGPLPELSALTELKALSAWGCRLTGEIPAWVYTLTALQVLDLAENDLTGEVSASIGDLQELRLLALGDNRLSGTVPAELGSLTELQTLDIADNALRGTLPASAANIESVFAQNNYLTGDVLSGLANSTRNFCDGAETAQYQLTASGTVRLSKNNRTNLYSYLRNRAVSGSLPAKSLLPADQYVAAVSNDPENKIELTFDANGIYVQTGTDVRTAENVTVTIQIKDNDGSEYSKTSIILTTETEVVSPAPATVHEPYVNGYTDGTFGPGRSIAREEVAAMLTRVLGYELTMPEDAPFPDVPVTKWSAANIAAAKEHGIVSGYGNGNFGPNDAMTRAELATVLVRIARADGREFTADEIAFSDVDANAWYAEYVRDAAKYGLVTGYTDGTFRPGATVARSEAVTMINRLLGRNPETAPTLGELECPFSDVAADYWAYLQIMEAAVRHEH